MAAITRLDYTNASTVGADVTDVIEVAFTAYDVPTDYVLVFFQNDGTVAGIVRFDQFPSLKSSYDPTGQRLFVFGLSTPVRSSSPAGPYTGETASNWNPVDLSVHSSAATYVGGMSYASSPYSQASPSDARSETQYAMGRSADTGDRKSKGNHIMLLNDATGQVVDFYSIGTVSSITAASGTPAAGTVSTVAATTGVGRVDFPHHAYIAGTAMPPQTSAGHPGEIVCFATGTRILTDQGYRPIEALRPGDHVSTYDDGLQSLRWVGAQRVEAADEFAPVFIPAGTFDNMRPLLVSQQHRFVLNDPWVELATGIPDCLISAQHMVGYHGICLLERPEIVYWHLLMDRHQLIWAEGALTESFFPGPQVLSSIDADVQAEILSLFPDLAYDPENGYGRLVRPPARRGECLMVMDNMTPSLLRDREK
jgi:hypothetical protein